MPTLLKFLTEISVLIVNITTVGSLKSSRRLSYFINSNLDPLYYVVNRSTMLFNTINFLLC